MCLGVPGRVTEVDELTALVDFWGVRRRVRLDLVDEPVAVGDYILNHVGFAIRRIPAEDVQTTLELYAQLLKETTGSGPEDLMASDVRSEIEGSQRVRPDRPPGERAEAAAASPEKEHRRHLRPSEPGARE
jgi:hydrogenase expression/formation protein HypC